MTSLCSLAMSTAPALWSAVAGGRAGQTVCGPSVLAHLPPCGPLAGVGWTVVVSRDLRLRRACDLTRMFKKMDD